MVAQHNIDSVRIGEEIFYNVFHRIFHNEKARQYFKFSQINFFNSTESLPGWNLWFQENMKAYQLALIQAGIVSDDQRRNGAFSAAEPIIEGRFAVRCFPDETAPELEDFSCTETLLRLGPHFDHTGTPTLQRNSVSTKVALL